MYQDMHASVLARRDSKTSCELRSIKTGSRCLPADYGHQDHQGGWLRGLGTLATSRARYGATCSFIPLAEDLGLIERISAWVLTRACADMGGLTDDVEIAVNFSPTHFRALNS